MDRWYLEASTYVPGEELPRFGFDFRQVWKACVAHGDALTVIAREGRSWHAGRSGHPGPRFMGTLAFLSREQQRDLGSSYRPGMDLVLVTDDFELAKQLVAFYPGVLMRHDAQLTPPGPAEELDAFETALAFRPHAGAAFCFSHGGDPMFVVAEPGVLDALAAATVSTHDLCHAYIAQRTDPTHGWAWERVTDIVQESPERGLALAIELVHMAPDQKAIAYIAAGPLEDLICKHQLAVLPALADAARKDPKLRHALLGVWGQNRMSAECLRRLDAIRGGPAVRD